jgi:hypothetical protein
MSCNNNNCDQGRTCNCELEYRSIFVDVLEGVITLAVIVGIIASMCMMFGYIWYRVTP